MLFTILNYKKRLLDYKRDSQIAIYPCYLPRKEYFTSIELILHCK